MDYHSGNGKFYRLEENLVLNRNDHEPITRSPPITQNQSIDVVKTRRLCVLLTCCCATAYVCLIVINAQALKKPSSELKHCQWRTYAQLPLAAKP